MKMNQHWRHMDDEALEEMRRDFYDNLKARQQHGRAEYGTVFVGDPDVHLGEELLDAAFYHWTGQVMRVEQRAALRAFIDNARLDCNRTIFPVAGEYGLQLLNKLESLLDSLSLLPETS